MHILQIDDDEDEFIFLQLAIKGMQDIKCSYANTIWNGIELLKTGLPNIVLLDINMPDVNGLECLRQIKLTENIAKIPVFVLSSSVTERCRAEAHKLGAAGCYVKPDSVTLLKKTIFGMLQKMAAGGET
ncbi:hypothetical protein HYN59_16395 [Flavobacterium album]|uniref:Response regulatory domain-containing protein n=1 Tax=Flavobacterium album TaxID=2175091 RepID=A0A2S1R1P3_9FLAO|nr:response regulator [Flavobacterium album]AWH86590.1 hypothetical protein HYN59_16395 [Flavobacterium album]